MRLQIADLDFAPTAQDDIAFGGVGESVPARGHAGFDASPVRAVLRALPESLVEPAG